MEALQSFEPVKYAMVLPPENYDTLRDDPALTQALLESHAARHPNPEYPLPAAWHVEDVTVELRTSPFNPTWRLTVVVGVIVPG